MGSFSEILIDPKDLRHDNKQVYYCIYTIQSTVEKKKQQQQQQHPIVLCFPIDGIT